MSKTLTAVLVVGVVLLVASPAQAKPVKQRAANAAACYNTWFVADEEAKTEQQIRDKINLTPNKCVALLSGYAVWLSKQYPSLTNPETVGDPIDKGIREATEDEFFGRIERAYRVTSKQVDEAGVRLGFWSRG